MNFAVKALLNIALSLGLGALLLIPLSYLENRHITATASSLHSGLALDALRGTLIIHKNNVVYNLSADAIDFDITDKKAVLKNLRAQDPLKTERYTAEKGNFDLITHAIEADTVTIETPRMTTKAHHATYQANDEEWILEDVITRLTFDLPHDKQPPL